MRFTPDEFQTYQGRTYATNEVGGIDIFTVEPTEPCPDCGEPAEAEWCDNGFGPYSVRVGPFRCSSCGWAETRPDPIDPEPFPATSTTEAPTP